MTILPKKKNVSKEKSDGENSDHAPHSPSPGEVNNLQLGRGRSGATSPNNWHSMPNEQSFEEYDNHPSSSTSHNKRRHRSSPHRTVRKHRADSHREREPSHATARPTPHRERTLPNAPASMASPVTPDAPSPIDEMLGVGHLPGGTASSPTRDTKLDTIEETGNNSEDEYNPMIPTEFNFPGCEKARNLDELDSYFGKALKEKRGLIIKQMVPDGACLFRAVADQVYGDQEMHPCVRKCCVEYMAKNADFFNHYVTEDFNTYLKRKLVASSHGNHIEIQAMCEMYSRPIEVFQYSLDPINIFHGTYATDNEPIRISYHRNTHYNSVCDPYKATIGVGLGLPGHKPGSADKNLMQQAQKLSEDSHIEKTMMEDKLRETDWEVTQETIEEQVARESYLQWLKDNEKRAQSQSSSSTRCGSASATCSSTATAGDYPTWDSGASGGGVSTISVAPNCSPPAARSPAPLSPHEAAPNPASILAQAQQLPSIQTNTMPLSTECNLLSTGMSPEQVDMATDLPLSLDSPLHLAGHSPTSHHNTSTTNTGAIATTSSAATNITASSDSSFPQTMQHHPSDMVGSGGSAILSDGGAVSGGATAGSSDGVSFNETASIMNDLPLQCYGLSDWDDSDIMAQVMAQSQQEYYDQLRKSSNARSSSSRSTSSTDCYASTSSHYPGNCSTSNDDS